jgi:2-polyprenyl-6-methoxyphenol hydroxylase-like FAD-dependent oxidoreductase
MRNQDASAEPPRDNLPDPPDRHGPGPRSEPISADVLIVGAGPVGAALAGELGLWGVSALVLDQTDGHFQDPRMHAVNIRTMELCRRWSLEQDLRDCGWPKQHPQDIVFLTGMAGHVLGRIPWPSIAAMRPPASSPTFAQRCPQAWFNPILHRFAERQPGVRILWNQRVEHVAQDGAGVVAQAVDVTSGAARRFTGRYLVACDGARSDIREQLGIARETSPTYGYSAEAIIESAELADMTQPILGGRYTLIDRGGVSASLLPYDGRERFRMTLMAEPAKVGLDDVAAAIRRLAGTDDLSFRFLSDVLPWANRETLAERFRLGRIFLAGDAAHTMPPTGGFGMNTGLLDALDLGWKLAGRLRGWGGETLLESYAHDRRGAVRRTAAMAGAIYRDWFNVKPQLVAAYDAMQGEGPAATAERQRIGDLMVATFTREFNALGGALGHAYAGSPISVDDGSATPVDDLTSYVPTARPGHRAPHLWLDEKRHLSTLDLFRQNYTLLAFAEEETAQEAAEPFRKAATALGLPLAVRAIAGPQGLDLYGARFALVRPDGHVCWRSDTAPLQAAAVLDVARGAGDAGAKPDEPGLHRTIPAIM